MRWACVALLRIKIPPSSCIETKSWQKPKSWQTNQFLPYSQRIPKNYQDFENIQFTSHLEAENPFGMAMWANLLGMNEEIYFFILLSNIIFGHLLIPWPNTLRYYRIKKKNRKKFSDETPLKTSQIRAKNFKRRVAPVQEVQVVLRQINISNQPINPKNKDWFCQIFEDLHRLFSNSIHRFASFEFQNNFCKSYKISRHMLG